AAAAGRRDGNSIALTGRRSSRGGAGGGRLLALEPRIKNEQPLVVLVAAVELLDRSLLALAGHANDEASALHRAGRGSECTKLATGARGVVDGAGRGRSGESRAGGATDGVRLQASRRPGSARRYSACGRCQLDLRFPEVDQFPFAVDRHWVFEAFAQKAHIV